MIDVDKLREDLKKEYLGAYFGGGFEAALIEALEIDNISDEDVINMANRYGCNIHMYQV